MLTEKVSIDTYPDGRMTAQNAANYIGVSQKTLATMRCKGTGPKFIKIGRVFYFQSDLDGWLADQVKVSSTAEYETRKAKPKK